MKRKKPKRQRLGFDDIELPLPLNLMIANVLPADVEVPDWGAPDAKETAEFRRFLDERFPREKFPEFRHAVEGPNLMPLASGYRGREVSGVSLSISGSTAYVTEAGPRSKLDNYRLIVETRRMWRAAAKIGRLIAVMTNKRVPALRICEFCENLFVAGRNNQRVCDKRCGAALRQQRKRDKAKQYELQRELSISKRNNELKKRA